MQLPITIEDKAWIDSNFQWLLSEFGVRRFKQMPMRLLTPDFFPELFEEESQAFIYYFDKISSWMGVAPEKITPVLVEAEVLDYQALGSFRSYINYQDHTEKYRIQISRDLLSNIPHLIATLAHEISHIKLIGEGRVHSQEGDHEFLTDLCTVYWGFGAVMANGAFDGGAGYIPGSGETHWSLSASGYLPLEMWAYALALFTYLKNDLKPNWTKALSKEVKPLFQKCLRYLIQTGDCSIELSSIKEKNTTKDSYQLALHSLNEIIDNQPESFDAGLLLKRVELNTTHHQMEAAFQDLNEILAKDSQNIDALVIRARLKMELQDDREAFEDINHVLEIKPDDVGALIIRARLYLLNGKDDEALRDLTQILLQKPEDLNSLLYRAYIRERKAKWAEALADYEKCTKLAPADWRPWMEKGWLRVRQQDLIGGLEDLNQALILEKNEAAAYFYKGIVLRKLGKLTEAIKYFDQALTLKPHWEDVEIERRFALQRQIGITEGDWVELCYFDIPAEVFDLRKAFRKHKIKHKVAVIAPSITAATNKGSVLLIPEWDAEEAWEIFHRMQGNTDFAI